MEALGLARLHLDPCCGMAASHALAALPGGAELSRSRTCHCVSKILRSLEDGSTFSPCKVGICSGRKGSLYTNTNKETKTAVAS